MIYLQRVLVIILGMILALPAGVGEVFSRQENLAPETSASPGSPPYFFFDQDFIAISKSVELTPDAPEKYRGNPVIPAQNPFTDLDLASGPFTVMFEEVTGGFRMWYTPYSRGKAGVHFGYGTSADGISWLLPELGLTEFEGSRCNNLLLTRVLGGESPFDRAAENPQERYKAVLYRYEPQPAGFSVSFSPDGLTWSPPLWVEELDDRDETQGRGASDVVNAFFDPVRNEFVAVFKMWSLTGQYQIPVKRGIDPPRCGRRIVGLSRSRDFRRWSLARQILLPDEKDPPTLDFYGLQAVLRRGDLFIGFLPCLIDDAPPDGIGWTELAYSRDGDNWKRVRLKVLDRSEGKLQAPDQAIDWVSELVGVGDREFIYYGGMEQGHKSGPRSGCLAFLPRNRFVALASSAGEGTILTRAFLVDTKKPQAMFLNVDASAGEVRVQLRTKGGVIEGYSFLDCDPISSDGLDIPVRWRGERAMPHRKEPVQVEFRLRNARLYTLSF